MKSIPLTRGYVAVVDADDFERAKHHKWTANVFTRADGSHRVYAVRTITNHDGKQKKQTLHRFIVNAQQGMDVDHVDGNPLNNRRENLRICTRAENTRNMRPRTHVCRASVSSALKGVCWHKRDRKWHAQIRIDGTRIHLGYFNSEQEAADAYDKAARRLHGNFARENGYAAASILAGEGM